jgi:hypothetical protein
MLLGSVARNQRGALTQAGAGIAASRRTLVDFARPFVSLEETFMRTIATRAAVLVALAATLSGCALTTKRPSIAELKSDPGRFQDRQVSIDGVVTSAWGVGVVPVRVYKVDDGTGELTVVAQRGGPMPTRGAHVRVKGRVNDLATFGGQSVGLHIEQTDLDFRRR